MPPRKPSIRTTKVIPNSSSFEDTAVKKGGKPNISQSTRKKNNNIGSFLQNDTFHMVLGLILLVLISFTTISFFSYFLTGAEDQSKMELSFSELHEKRNEIKNITSMAGALIAHHSIHKGFGIASFAFLFFFLVLSFKLLKIRLLSLTKSFFHSFFWVVWLSITLGFFDHLLKPNLFFWLGGQHGVVASQWLISYIGETGMVLGMVGSFSIYLLISAPSTKVWFQQLTTKRTPNSNATQTLDDSLEVDPEEKVSWATAISKTDAETMVVEFESEEIPIASNSSGVSFEVKKPENSDDDLPFDSETNGRSDENDDPLYNVARLGKFNPTLDLSKYVPPTLNLLKVYGADHHGQIDMQEQNANKERITSTLQNYGIEIKTIKATVGPTITLYEIVPKEGVRISKIRNLESDIMLSLAATGIRIIAPIPGKGTIGIEVPNADPHIVSMHSVIASRKFIDSKFELPIAFGRTITNEVFMVDLTKLPHLLVAGATGQGKSVGLNAIITSLLYKKHPAELKLVLIDPKKVEFNIYGGIEKHFLAKLPDGDDAIITDTTKVLHTLSSLCREMDNRYDLLKKAHVRNIREYNDKFTNRQLNPEKGHKFLPYIVVIVDEFGDLIMTAGKEVELPIARIAQLARAVGIHMIIATQRPSVNIITGVIKANFPARVAFRVSSMIDSRTIIDGPGANQLVGRGDMLFTSGNEIIRVQCSFVDTPEVENIVGHIGQQLGYPTAFYLPEYTGPETEGGELSTVDMSKRDPLFEEAARLIVATQQGSTSNIQRKFSIGYNRAGRIVDQLEVAGIIGPNEGSKARQVLLTDEFQLEHILKHL